VQASWSYAESSSRSAQYRTLDGVDVRRAGAPRCNRTQLPPVRDLQGDDVRPCLALNEQPAESHGALTATGALRQMSLVDRAPAPGGERPSLRECVRGRRSFRSRRELSRFTKGQRLTARRTGRVLAGASVVLRNSPATRPDTRGKGMSSGRVAARRSIPNAPHGIMTQFDANV
jgi:hypothetical protein